MNQANPDKNSHDSFPPMNTSSRSEDTESIPVRSRSAVPVWKTPSVHDKKTVKKNPPKPVSSDLKNPTHARNESVEASAVEPDDLIDEADSSLSTNAPVENARIITEKSVRRSYFAEFLSFVRSFLPDSVSESRLRTFNFILAIFTFILGIIIFIAVVLR